MQKIRGRKMERFGKIITNTEAIMEFKKSEWDIFSSLILIALFLTCCKPIVSIKKKHYFKKGEEYCIACNNEFSNLDTMMTEKNLTCIFHDGVLKQVGKLKNGKKVGVWYFYSATSKGKELDLVVKYKASQDSSWIWSRGMINQSW